MLIKYIPVTDEYTTYNLIEPDHEINDEINCTRLCELDGEVYVHIPDILTLPEQHSQIEVTEVTLTAELKKRIKDNSHLIKYINKSVVENIRKKYSVTDEFKVNRGGIDTPEWIIYNEYCEECVSIGAERKAEYGL